MFSNRRLDSSLVRGSLDDVEHVLGSSAVEVTTVSDVNPLWIGRCKVGDGLISDILEYNSLKVLLRNVVREIKVVSEDSLVTTTFGLLGLPVMEVHVFERGLGSPTSRLVSAVDRKGRSTSRMQALVSE